MSPKPSTGVLLTYSLRFIQLSNYIKLHISTGEVYSYLLITLSSAKNALISVFNCNNISDCRENGYMSGLAHWVYWPS